jgi:putative SOS response-associated peptidase YedK
MCYDLAARYESERAYAILRGDFDYAEYLTQEIEKIKPSLIPFHYVLGFDRPKLLTFLDSDPLKPEAIKWGLVPHWAKDEKMVANTLNAKLEEYKTKPSYSKAGRCLIYVDAIYEHHDFNKKKYPFRIFMKDKSPMILAGLWAERGGVKTTSIVTTEANELMAKIHNTAKRMPLILTKENQDEWLVGKDPAPVASELLDCYTVGQLRGKSGIGNKPEVADKVVYEELKWN